LASAIQLLKPRGIYMVYSVDEEKVITRIPYKSKYRLYRCRLSDVEYNAIVEELNRKIDSNEVHTSSWLPGSDWTDTVYEPIYSKACNEDIDEAGKCFGLFLWVVMMNRPETWAFGRYKKGDIPIEGLTYFIVNT
jgi:predicted MPP superfamily phosphohydrolase